MEPTMRIRLGNGVHLKRTILWGVGLPASKMNVQRPIYGKSHAYQTSFESPVRI